jgi:hypothetical protein
MVLAGLAAARCGQEPPDPITIANRAITVENQTTDEWQNVEIWLNDHYRVTRWRMPPKERFSAPLTSFVAGFGQRFDPGRQSPRGIEVTASTADGRRITLTWGSGRRR